MAYFLFTKTIQKESKREREIGSYARKLGWNINKCQAKRINIHIGSEENTKKSNVYNAYFV